MKLVSGGFVINVAYPVEFQGVPVLNNSLGAKAKAYNLVPYKLLQPQFLQNLYNYEAFIGMRQIQIHNNKGFINLQSLKKTNWKSLSGTRLNALA